MVWLWEINLKWNIGLEPSVFGWLSSNVFKSAAKLWKLVLRFLKYARWKSKLILLPTSFTSTEATVTYGLPLFCVRRIDDNALRSTLRINGVAPSDFDGEYVCWMQNKHATLNPARTLIIHRRRKLNWLCSHIYSNLHTGCMRRRTV